MDDLISRNALLAGIELKENIQSCDRYVLSPMITSVLLYMIDNQPTVEAITREDFIKEAKELITAFVGSGEKTEENRIIFALVFGNLELRLFGSRDGDGDNKESDTE